MAGERYASITIRAALSHNDVVRGGQTQQLTFQLGTTTLDLYRGGQPGQFIVPDPDEAGVGEDYGLRAIENVAAVLGGRLFALGLPYSVSTPKKVGTKSSYYDTDKEAPVIEFTVTATRYGPDLGPLSFDPHFHDPYFPGAFEVTTVGNISPLYATAAVTHTGIYGSHDGAIELTVASDEGGSPVYFYAWADGANTPTRTGLGAGTYQCVVTSTTGAGTTVTATVLSDPELLVAVASTPNSITLTTSGGVAPYAYAWADGVTTAARTQLPGGTYGCLVTDAHGATVRVEVRLDVAGRYWFSGNPIPLSLVASSPDVVAFGLEVWLEQDYGSGDFAPVGPALEQPADAEGRTTFEVQLLLEPYVAPPVPAPGGGLALATGLFKRFYLKHHERTAAGRGGATTLSPAYLVHGGLDYREAAVGTWFSSYQADRLPFLTWEPTTKKVLPDQPEYLYFMALSDLPAGFAVQLRLYWPDGTQDEGTLTNGPAALPQEVFSIGVGPLAINLAYHETRKQQPCRRYDIRVLDPAGALLSETRTFVPDHRPCPVRRYFLYANSLGGWNTLVCRGRASQELATKTQAADNGRPAGYDPLRGDYTISQRTGLATLKCYTGARSSEQLTADRDFLLSERVLLLAGGRYLAGQVKDGKTVVLDEDETRRLVQFDFELPRERFYSATL